MIELEFAGRRSSFPVKLIQSSFHNIKLAEFPFNLITHNWLKDVVAESSARHRDGRIRKSRSLRDSSVGSERRVDRLVVTCRPRCCSPEQRFNRRLSQMTDCWPARTLESPSSSMRTFSRHHPPCLGPSRFRSSKLTCRISARQWRC